MLLGCDVVYGTEASQGPSALSLIVTVQPLPADGGTYPSLIVTLGDLSENPTMTLSSMTIFLSSSQDSVATLPPTVELAAGRTYLVVDVTTTEKPGTTAITAASSGLKSASANLQTVGTGQTPTQLALSILPSKTLQSFVGDDALVVIQLANGSSLPSYSNESTQVIIISSNTSVVESTITLTIPPGKSYAYSSIKAKNSGTTTFTALSSGLTSSSASLSILPVPFSASVTASPNPISANATATITVVVSLAGQGLPNASITLSSNFGIIAPSKSNTDKTGQALATFTSRNPGVATVMANIDHPYIGPRNASVAIIIPEPNRPVVQSPFQLIYLFIPVILAVAIIGIMVVAISKVLRRRTASMKEEGEEK
ncbi:MAG: Ig-like domain-containing protein [Thaumarchaeota archaeon]|nr:Ig-like domain-containing protein [Nitrososphaerota archaeon]